MLSFYSLCTTITHITSIYKYSNVIVSSHVSLICVNILMARNMESFDRVTGLCVISQITYYLRPNHLSVHKKQFQPYEIKHNRRHATQAMITFNLFPLSIYFLSLYVDWLKSHLSGLITANNVWYLSVWLWHWPNAAFVASKSHAIIKKMYPPAQILTRYRTYSMFLSINQLLLSP